MDIGLGLELNGWNMEIGCISSFFFLSSFEEHPTSGLITKLYNDDEIVVSSRADLACFCNSFYSKIYSTLEADGQCEDCCVELLHWIPVQICKECSRGVRGSYHRRGTHRCIASIDKGDRSRTKWARIWFFQGIPVGYYTKIYV